MRLLVFLFFLFCSTSFQVTSAQSPQQQIQKAITDLKKQISDQEKLIADAKTNSENPETIKAMEDDLKQLKQQLTMLENSLKSVSNIPASMVQQVQQRINAETQNPEDVIPAKNTAVLNDLPKKTLTTEQLIKFLLAFYNELKLTLPTEKIKDAQDIIIICEDNYEKIALKGVAAWYNHAPSVSVLLLVYAASKSPGDNILNNCGAILNLYRREDKSLPVLLYVLPHQPNNCTLLNNIGQAYAGLGDKEAAMHYFSLVFKFCSQHPEANATAAYIAYSKGDKVQAANYMERSLHTAYSQEHMDFYKSIRADANPLINPDIKLTNNNYFIPNRFTPAPNCKNWEDCEIVTAKQEATKKGLDGLRKKFEDIVIQNSSPTTMEPAGPLAKKAQYIKEVISAAYTEARQKASFELLEKTSRITTDSREASLALDKEFEPQYKACEGVGGDCLDKVIYKYCIAKRDLDNKYFLALTDAAQTFESVWYAKDVKYYNNLVFLTAYTAPNKNVLKAECATYTNYLIDQIRVYTLSECNPSGKPNCIEPPAALPEALELPEFKVEDCPINIRVPFIVGHVSLNCERFEFEAGEGVIFKYEKNFKERESSFAIGLGVEASIPGFDASATAMAGFKFDGNLETTDVFGTGKADVNILGWGTPIISGAVKVGVSSGLSSSFTVMGK